MLWCCLLMYHILCMYEVCRLSVNNYQFSESHPVRRDAKSLCVYLQIYWEISQEHELSDI